MEMRLKKYLRQKRAAGFTLLEMLIYVALVAVVISAIAFFAIWAIQVGTRTKANAEVLGNARRAMETMVYEIRKSQSVYAPTSIFDNSPGQLSLEQSNESGATEDSTFIDFFLCEEALCVKREKENPVALTNSSVRVTSLIFSQRLNSVNSPSIKITLQVVSASPAKVGDTISINLTTAANLRSYQ